MLEAAFSNFGGGLSIAYSAFNLHLYADFARLLETARSRPRLVLFPINPRSFSPQWSCNPAWRFDAVRALLADLATDRAAPRGPVPDVVETPGFYDEYLAQTVEYPLSALRTIAAFQAVVRDWPADAARAHERLRTVMIYHYTHPLRPDHPQLNSLVYLLRRLRRLGIEVLPYVTPVNRGLGRSLSDRNSTAFSQQTCAQISERAAEERCEIVDWSDMLGPEAFFHAGSPTEHLRLSGRQALLDAVVKSVAALLSRGQA